MPHLKFNRHIAFDYDSYKKTKSSVTYLVSSYVKDGIVYQIGDFVTVSGLAASIKSLTFVTYRRNRNRNGFCQVELAPGMVVSLDKVQKF